MKKAPQKLLLLILLNSILSCNQNDKKKPEEISEFEVIKIKAENLEKSNSFSANLEGIQVVELRPQVSGYIKEIKVREGQRVNKGDILFIIEDSKLNANTKNTEASIAKEQSNVDKTLIELNKIKKLAEANIVSNIQVENANAEYKIALATLKEAITLKNRATIDQEFSKIHAPFSGYIGRIPYKKGSLVDNQIEKPLTTISNIDIIYGYFSMSELDFANFNKRYKGNTFEEKINNIPPVELILADGSKYELKGKVDFINSQFDESTGAISLKASFPNPKGEIRSGNTGTIILYQKIEKGIAIPKTAAFELQDKTIIYKLDKNNNVRQLPVEIDEIDNTTYQVIKGLSENDIIVRKGIDRLKDSLKIIPKYKIK